MTHVPPDRNAEADEGLALRGVRAGYAGTPVLESVDLAFAPGLVHGLVGRNGAGKTTLLDVIAGFLPPMAGAVTMHGRPLGSEDVAYLPTELHFYPRITGREYLAVFRAAPPSASPFDADGWAAVFDVPLDRHVDAYSAGMRRKLALLGALALDRPVLLLDEPANALDIEANQLLGRVLRSLAARGRTVIVTSHVLESLTATCDRVHLLARGVIHASYRPEEFHALAGDLLSDSVERRLASVDALLGAGGSDE
jgi:ABC-2 type transport system ATP-binding protein